MASIPASLYDTMQYTSGASLLVRIRVITTSISFRSVHLWRFSRLLHGLHVHKVVGLAVHLAKTHRIQLPRAASLAGARPTRRMAHREAEASCQRLTTTETPRETTYEGPYDTPTRRFGGSREAGADLRDQGALAHPRGANHDQRPELLEVENLE